MFEALSFATSLGSDNHSGVHPKVFQAMLDANRGHAHAYGMDEVCDLADEEFRRVFGKQTQAQFVFTGTAANVLCFSSLKSFEAIVCSEQSHLHVDECGAPEKFLGAKLWTIRSADGKIHPKDCAQILSRGGDQHYSQPRAVSLTQPTELGVCYSLDELREWREFCDQKNLMLHIDGARLVNAAAHLQLRLEDMTQLADVVSFGGTKNGLMGAEACLLIREQARQNFKFYRKQAMQLSSKTRFLAAQFYAFLKDDLWLDIANRQTSQAKLLADGLKEFAEIKLAHPVQSNALFVELPKPWIKPLREKFFFYIWSDQVCRWMVGFDWNDSMSEALIHHIREVKKCFPVA